MYKGHIRRPSPCWLLLLLALLAVAAGGGVGRVQFVPGGPSPVRRGVKVDVESLGVGGMARAGDWCGIRLKIMDTGTKNRDLLIRVAGLDYDGDTPLVQRAIAGNPNVWQSVWLYLRLPYSFNPD